MLNNFPNCVVVCVNVVDRTRNLHNIITWCENNAGKYMCSWNYDGLLPEFAVQGIRTRYVNERRYKFMFANAEDATAFKLKFGGK